MFKNNQFSDFQKKNPQFLLKKCLMRSILDDSWIDLTRRDHLNPRPAPLLPPNCLSKRSFEKFSRARPCIQALPGFHKVHAMHPLDSDWTGTGRHYTKSPAFKSMRPKMSALTYNPEKFGLTSMPSEVDLSYVMNSHTFASPGSSSNKVSKAFLDGARLLTPQTNPDSTNKNGSENNDPELVDLDHKIPDMKNKNRADGAKKAEKSTHVLAGNFTKILKTMIEIFKNRKNKPKADVEKGHLKTLIKNTKIEPDSFGKIQHFLKKFLGDKPLAREDLLLSDLEIILFLLFVIKKKYEGLDSLDWTLAQLEALRRQRTKKTSEQNYKIIFKKFFKLIVQDFNAKHALASGDDLQFYKSNFGAIADSLNQDWRQLQFKFVFNEDRSKSIKKNGRQSKKNFARVVQRNAEFMDSLEKYLRDELVLKGQRHGVFADYWPVIETKLEYMIDRWMDKFKSKKNFLINSLIKQAVGRSRFFKAKQRIVCLYQG